MIIRLFIILGMIFLNLFSFSVFAEEEAGYLLMPESENEDAIDRANSTIKGDPEAGVWDIYSSCANDKNGKFGKNNNKTVQCKDMTMGDKMSSGIMGWNTLINYAAYLVKVLSQLGMVVGAVMIIYAGYLYGVSVFTGDSTKGTGAIKDAVIGVVLVIFSYAIVKILTSMFL